MKIIVTHTSPDLDAIMSVWLLKKFLPGWENADVQFVAAGERIDAGKWKDIAQASPIEKIENNEVIHVDTGLGSLDHHQTVNDKISAASLSWDFVESKNPEFKIQNDKTKNRIEALSRMVKVIVKEDHFKDVFRKDALADYHEFDLGSILDGLKFQFPDQDDCYIEFICKSLDAVLHEFENRIWAEKEIAQNGQKFSAKSGPGIAFEIINDSVIKLSQKMGYVVVVRKDPRKGYVRIKAIPAHEQKTENGKQEIDIDLSSAYEKLKKMDPDATWYLHVSKKMLLNGSTKNPGFRPTRLSLKEIIKVLEKV